MLASGSFRKVSGCPNKTLRRPLLEKAPLSVSGYSGPLLCPLPRLADLNYCRMVGKIDHAPLSTLSSDNAAYPDNQPCSIRGKVGSGLAQRPDRPLLSPAVFRTSSVGGPSDLQTNPLRISPMPSHSAWEFLVQLLLNGL